MIFQALIAVFITLCLNVPMAEGGPRAGPRDRDGWGQLNTMLQHHTVANFRAGMTMAEKVRAMRMISDDVATLSVVSQPDLPLLVTDQRDRFFERLRSNAIYVRNGTLYGAPPPLPDGDLSHLRPRRLFELARQCGLSRRRLDALGTPAAAAARIRRLCGPDAPARDKLLLLPRAELIRLCRRFSQRGALNGAGLSKARLADRLLRLRWRGLPRTALAHAAADRLGRASGSRSDAQARAAMVRLLEHADAMQARTPPPSSPAIGSPAIGIGGGRHRLIPPPPR
jgi:hypothetical protein